MRPNLRYQSRYVPQPDEIALDLDLDLGALGGGFDASTLFASNEDGGLYEPWDLTSLYEDTDGGDNASIDGTVGIVLDKRKMGGQTAAAFIAAQSEIVTNGDFSAGDTGWTEFLGTDSTFLNGACQYRSDDGSYQSVQQDSILTIGEWYILTFDVTAVTTVGAGLRARLGTNSPFSPVTSVGSYTFIGQCTFDGNLIFDRAGGITNIEFDNVSVKHIPGNHLVAPSDAARLTLRQSGELYRLEGDGSADEISGAISGMSATSTVVTAFDPTSDATYTVHSDGTNYLLRAADGDATATISSGAGTPTYREDGASATYADRNALHDALTGAPHVMTIESADLSSWSTFGFGNLGAGQFFDGFWYGCIVIDRALTADERSNAETLLAEKSDVTL